MSYFIDRWYGEAENLYYKGWIVDRDVINTSPDGVVFDDFDLFVSISDFDMDAGISSAVAIARNSLPEISPIFDDSAIDVLIDNFNIIAFRDSINLYQVEQKTAPMTKVDDFDLIVISLSFEFSVAIDDYDMVISNGRTG